MAGWQNEHARAGGRGYCNNQLRFHTEYTPGMASVLASKWKCSCGTRSAAEACGGEEGAGGGGGGGASEGRERCVLRPCNSDVRARESTLGLPRRTCDGVVVPV
jgi:hypothetical protein